MDGFEVVIEGRSFLEGPRWHDGRIWVSDFYTGEVLSAAADGSDLRIEAQIDGQPSGLGWLPDGRLLFVSMVDHTVMRRESDGSLVPHADVSALCGGLLNDMAVDASGRAYVGNFGFDLMSGGAAEVATLARVDPDGSVSAAADGLHFPNGTVFLGGELVVAETMGNRLSAFLVGADGTLGPRRDWAKFGVLPPAGGELGATMAALRVAPDGICADAEGAIWVADAVGNRALRVAEGGAVLQEISTGDLGTYAVALGGDDGRTLYLCTAPDFFADRRRTAREAQLLAVRVDVAPA
jgi:sugar lactone lactonase YvrE